MVMSNTEMEDSEKNLTASVKSAGDPAYVDLFSDEAVDPIYQAKAHVINQAIQEIGMGRSQWYLFVIAGFGFVADSGWLALTSNILYPAVLEYHFNPPLLYLAMAIGFLVGSLFWGLSSDIWGRRFAFNITLLIAGTFGVASGGANSFVTLASLIAVVGLGVGGNIPVDSVVFLDVVPGSHQYLLTTLNVFLGVGYVFANGIAWAIIPKNACNPAPAVCTRSQNMGWRYYCFTIGGLTLFLWTVRFVMPLLESPRFLVGQGKDEEAVQVIHKIATINRKTSNLTVEQLRDVGSENQNKNTARSGKRDILSYAQLTFLHTKGLFATPKMAWSFFLFFTITLLFSLAGALYATFLPYILVTRGNQFGDASLDIAYRNLFFGVLPSIPSSLLAGYLVERPFLGRKGVLAISAVLSGAILLGSTTAKSSNQLLGWNIGYSFCLMASFSSLNALGTETYQGQHRGTGAGLQSSANRLANIVGPIIVLHADIATAVPVYIAGAMTICSGLLALLLPYEARGHSSI